MTTTTLILPSISTTNSSYTNKTSIQPMTTVCQRVQAYLTGVLSSGSTAFSAKPFCSKFDNLISTKSSQSLVYDSVDLSAFITIDLGDAKLNIELMNSLSALDEIATLENGWNGNGASAFSEELVNRCKKLVETLEYQPAIFPTAQESIQFEWDNDAGEYLEVELFENGTCQMAQRKSDGTWSEQILVDIAIGEYVKEFFT